MTREEKALYYFGKKFHCSQAVLAAYADKCGITEKQALQLGGCFGGGMRKGEVCGAVTGALMALGLLYGQYDPDDLKSREQANRVNDAMMQRFADKCGSYICNELLGHDMSTTEGAQRARDEGLFTDFCPKMVANAVAIVQQIIDEQECRDK